MIFAHPLLMHKFIWHPLLGELDVNARLDFKQEGGLGWGGKGYHKSAYNCVAEQALFFNVAARVCLSCINYWRGMNAHVALWETTASNNSKYKLNIWIIELCMNDWFWFHYFLKTFGTEALAKQQKDECARSFIVGLYENDKTLMRTFTKLNKKI